MTTVPTSPILGSRTDWRVLVTGSSGFIGTNVVSAYLASGASVMGVDTRDPQECTHGECHRSLDILDSSGLERLSSEFRPTHIIHLAAATGMGQFSESQRRVNVQGTLNVARIARRDKGCRAVAFASSLLVCRNGEVPASPGDYSPINGYAESKVGMELALFKEFRGVSCPWAIFRPTAMWGPWFDVPYRNFFDAVIARRYFHIGSGSTRKLACYVGNGVAQLDSYLSNAKQEPVGQVFYLYDSPGYTLREWAEEIERAMARNGSIRSLPYPLACTIAAIGSGLKFALGIEPPLTLFRLKNMLTEMDLSKAEWIAPPRECPYSLRSSVYATMAWLRAQPTH